MIRSSFATIVMAVMLVGCGESDLEIELRKKVEEMTAERDGIASTLKSTADNLKSTTDTLAQTNSELESTRAKVTETTTALEQLQAKLESETAQLQAKLESETARLQDQVSTSQGLLDQERASMEASTERGLMLAGLIDDLRSKSNATIASLRSEVEAASAKASSLGGLLSEQSALGSKLDSELAQTQLALATTSEQRDELTEHLELAREYISKVDSSFDKTKSHNRELANELETTQQSLAQRNATIAKLEPIAARTPKLDKMLAAMTKQAAALDQELKSTTDALVNLSKKAKLQDEALAKANERLTIGSDRIVALEARLKNVTEKNEFLVNEMKLQVAEIANEKAELERESETITMRQEQLLESESSFNTRAKATHQRWMMQQDEINQTWARLNEQLGEEQRSLQSMRATFEAEREFLVARINRLVAERNNLRAEINGGWGEIDALRLQLSKAREKLQ